MVELFGTPQILFNGEWVDVRSAKARALLFYLAVNQRVHMRSTLAALLWSEKPEADARMNLRQAMYNLHQMIPNCLTTTHDSLKLNEDHSVMVDVLRFIEEANAGLKGCRKHDNQEALRKAAALYQGEFLAGLYVEDAIPYEEWMMAWREQLHRLAFQVLQRLTAVALTQQNIYEGLHHAQRLLALEPWHEESHFQLMQLLVLNGQTQAALAQYEECCRLLHKELDVKPSNVLTQLADEIRRGDGTPELRLQNADRLADIQQSGAVPFVAENASLQPVHKPRHNLSVPLSSFVGRSRDLDKLDQMLSAPETRLISLIGPGGVGKTRLANQLGLLILPDFHDGVWFIDLLPVHEEELIVQTIASVFAIHEQAHYTPLENLCCFLADKQLLLLIDNCEHLIDAAAQLVAALLSAASHIKILATSREPLRLNGERCVPLLPLALPAHQPSYRAQQLISCESVQFFVERASAQSHTFALSDENAEAVAHICRQLDGIPLAIELVAARTRSFSVQQIAKQLDRTPDAQWRLASQGSRDAHPRHQTLFNLIAWSYGLLHPDERLLFDRLAIFAGSWSLAAAEAICSDGPSMPDVPLAQGAAPSSTTLPIVAEKPTRYLSQDAVFDLLATLVDKSLVIAEPDANVMRYRLLETVRHFALGQLMAEEEENWLRDRHLNHYMHLMEKEKLPHSEMQHKAWQAQVMADLDNIRAALTWSLRCGAASVGLRLALAASELWFSRGFHREAVYWVQLLLALPATAQEKKLRLTALNSIGFTQWWVLGSYAQARALQQEALILAQELDDQDCIEKTLNNLGGVALHTRNYAEASCYLRQSLARTDKTGNELNRAWSSILLGEVMLLQDCTDEAEKHYTVAAGLLRLHQRRSLLAYPIRRLGQIAFLRQDAPAALTHYEESLELNLDAGEVEGRAACIAAYAALLFDMGFEEQSVQLCAAVSMALTTNQSQLSLFDGRINEELIDKLRTRMDEETFQIAWTAGTKLSLEQAVDRIQLWQVQIKCVAQNRPPELIN